MADAALADADKAIELDGGYSKAFYRKGQAHNARKEFAEALAAFERGLSIDPTNKTFAEQITKAKTAAAKVGFVTGVGKMAWIYGRIELTRG